MARAMPQTGLQMPLTWFFVNSLNPAHYGSRTMKKPASISLDLDNLWAYMRAHGLPGWRDFPTYLPRVVPKILESTRELDLQLTVFVVGRDADMEENRESLLALVKAGHSIGNHSYLHEPWMHRYTRNQLADEIDKAHMAIQRATGIAPGAFRGPGFSVSTELLQELCLREYRYDASLLPTFIGPIVRAAYFRSADLTDAERDKRKKQFGYVRDGFKPIRPFRWKIGSHELLEIPVTTMPVFRVPMHLTYIHYLAQTSPSIARAYFWLTLKMCKVFRVSPSILLHPLDYMAADELPELKCFPGFGNNSEIKRSMTNWCLKLLKEQFDVKSLDDFVSHITNTANSNSRSLRLIKAP